MPKLQIGDIAVLACGTRYRVLDRNQGILRLHDATGSEERLAEKALAPLVVKVLHAA